MKRPTVFGPARRADPNPGERRATPRHAVTWPLIVELRGATTSTQSCDISEGGICVQGLPDLEPGARALLSFEGLALQVPCIVVGRSQDGGTRIRFELEGMGKREFLKQLSRSKGLAILAETRS